uniref:Uncharacterized protein n=1 Tax=Rhizophora mucronata TaxID=61149 RepID=A0A2P2R4I1_RHIMU
MLVLSFNQAE